MAKAKQKLPAAPQAMLFMPAAVTKDSFGEVQSDARLIKSEQIPFLVNWLRDSPELFIDYECAWGEEPFILGAFTPDKGARVVDFRFTPQARQAVIDGLSARQLTQRTVAFNIGFEVMMSQRMGFTLGGQPWDPCAAAFAVNEMREPWGEFGPHTQKALCYHELKVAPKYALAIKEWLKANTGQSERHYELIPPSLIIPYNAEDLELGWRLHKHLEAQVERNRQVRLVQTDSELGAVVERLQRRGIAFDKDLAVSLLADISNRRKSSQARIIEALDGRAIDVLKDQSLFGLIYGTWKLPLHEREEKTGSLDAEVLEWMLLQPDLTGKQKVVIKETLELREFDKMTGTYLLPWTYEHSKEVDGGRIINPHLNQMGPRTRRFSATNPNMQNVPTRTDLGKLIRAVFRNRKGYTTYSMDESQAEYRTMAHYCNARALIEAYKTDPTVDFHQITSDMMKLPRKVGKNVNLGKVYGMGIAKLMRSCNCSEAEARAIDTKYNRMIPELIPHRKMLEHFVKQHGYIVDEFGGRRHIPAIHAHIALNTEQQMTVADLIREAMVRAAPLIYKAGGEMLLQVHDEIIFELPGDTPEALEAHKPVLRTIKHEAMENYPQFRVPFKSDVNRWVPDWSHEVEVNLAA